MIAITPQTTGMSIVPLGHVGSRPPAAQVPPAPQDAPKPSPATPAPGRLLDITT